MFCTRCGANNLDNDQFCRSCSAPLTKSGSAQGQGAPPGSPYPYSTPGAGQPHQPYSAPGGGYQQQPPPGYGSQPGYPGYQQPFVSPADHPPKYPYQGYSAYPAPASGRATAAMIMSLISFFTCGLFLSVPGMIMGKMEMNAIQRGESSPAGETQAKVGFYVGLVVTILYGLLLIGYVILIVLGIAIGATSPN
jgi:Domain of unknown function (DUF4190)/zinc-ribbon domain